MKVKEVMTPGAHTIAPSAPIREAANLMRHLNIGMLPVIDEERLVGVVTDRDLVVRGLADNVDVGTATIRRVMTPVAVSVSPEAEIDEAVELMCREKIGRLVVQNWKGEPVGILSAADVAVLPDGEYSQRLSHVLGNAYQAQHVHAASTLSA
jgi:CBS domain-containing protein